MTIFSLGTAHTNEHNQSKALQGAMAEDGKRGNLPRPPFLGDGQLWGTWQMNSVLGRKWDSKWMQVMELQTETIEVLGKLAVEIVVVKQPESLLSSLTMIHMILME